MRYEDEIYVVSYDQIAHIKLKTKCQMTTNDDNSSSKLWPDLETKAFINIMLDEVALLTSRYGNMSNDVWTSMTTKLNAVTNRSYKKEQLKEKIHRLHAMYHEFYSLLQNTEFKWNAKTNTVAATAEVWQNYLQSNDRTTQFQKKGCDHYKLLGIIFNNKKENEAFHYSSNEENELDNQYLNIVRGSRVHNDMQEVECVTCSVKRKIPLKDTMNMCMSRDEATSFVSSDCSITKCVAALEEIEDISNDIYLKALKEFKDPDWREMFIAMSNDRRRG